MSPLIIVYHQMESINYHCMSNLCGTPIDIEQYFFIFIYFTRYVRGSNMKYY